MHQGADLPFANTWSAGGAAFVVMVLTLDADKEEAEVEVLVLSDELSVLTACLSVAFPVPLAAVSPEPAQHGSRDISGPNLQLDVSLDPTGAYLS